MVKKTHSRLNDVNRILTELRDLLPEARFDYDEATGVLLRVVLNISEDPLREINFFDSRPRSFPTPNLLCHPHQSLVEQSKKYFNGSILF
ncbi:MAG: hypothetical protein ACYDBP_04160 [Leptospirales bacterium]